jgi:hypothetical protein
VKDLHREPRRSGASVAGGSLTREMSVRVGAAATKPGRSSTARWVGSGKRDAEVYERNRRFFLRPVMSHRPETWRIWAGRGAHLFPHVGAGNFRRGLCLPVRKATVKELRHNRGDTAGTESGAYCDKRSAVNTGTVPVPPPCIARPARTPGAGSIVGRSGRDGAEPP